MTPAVFASRCTAALKAAKSKLTVWGWPEVEDCIADVFKEFQTQERAKTKIDDEWLSDLQAMPCYSHLDIRRELQKMQVWACANSRIPSRKRFVNWLNKAERPMTLNGRAGGHTALIPAPSLWRSRMEDEFPESRQVRDGIINLDWAKISTADQKSISDALKTRAG